MSMAGLVFSVFLVERFSTPAGFAGIRRGGAVSSGYYCDVPCKCVVSHINHLPCPTCLEQKETAVQDRGVLNSDLLPALGKCFSQDCAMPEKYPQAIRTRLLLKTCGAMPNFLVLHEHVVLDVNKVFCCPK